MKEKCSNCGQNLTEQNVRLALEDAGEDVEKVLTEQRRDDGRNQTIITFDHYTFCCPSYSDETGCQGYGRGDEEKPAYWIYR